MKVSHVLLISLLIVGALFVPTVSAETIEGQINDTIYQEIQQIPAAVSNGNTNVIHPADWAIYFDPDEPLKPSMIKLHEVQLSPTTTSAYAAFPNHQEYDLVLKSGTQTVCNNVKLEITRGPFDGVKTYGDVKITFDNWNDTYLNLQTSPKHFAFIGLPTENPELRRMYTSADLPDGEYPPGGFHVLYRGLPLSRLGYHEFYFNPLYFKNNYTISTGEYGTDIHITRIIDGYVYPSKIIITKLDGTEVYTSPDYETLDGVYAFPYRDIRVDIEEEYGNIYRIFSGTVIPTEPTDLRTGTVTMTDNNGTSISGFDVTAVNHYTGEEFTASTDTDVAVMTLPMERTIRMRNPQTGEYEDTVIGYYRFYGQSPGYKMLFEGGIQVSVVPEKYGSYELCDIRVTSESGPLTGKHLFQIRSRSDNSILQTGTISAQSATTGEWYNTTVSGGIATLILPYDTSNPISQYAGNYYVYATSPGYEDSDYGTQIVVMPQTVSEIRDILLTPIGGIPPAGNVTLRIQAFSETGPGVVNAEIFIAGVMGEGASVWDTYTASSTGYLAVSVPGNSTYDIVASGAGYYDSARRVEVLSEDPPLIEIKLYLSGAPTIEPTTQPTGWPTEYPTTQPTGGIPDEDDDSEGFLMQAVRGIGLAFGVGFSTAKLIFGMLLALSIGYATAKQLRGGAAEFGLGLLGGTLLGVLIGLLPVWIIVVLLLVVGLYIGNRYVGGSNNG